jgi:predicted dehydrogenase
MAEAVYRGAIIGLGFVGAADQVSGDALGQHVENLDGTHVQAMRNHPRVELVAGSSRDEGRRARFAEMTSARTYADWREMLSGEELDVVSIATYAPQHAEMTVACAEHGVRAVYCEKPMATTIGDAERMLAACRVSNTLLVVNHNRRFHAHYRRLRDLVAVGELGDLTSVSAEWGTGRLGNVGTHMFNAVCMLTGRHVAAVSATLDLAGRPDCRGKAFHDPGGWGLLRMDGDLMVTFDAADYGMMPGAITLNGTLGRATIRANDVDLQRWGGPVEHWPAMQRASSSMDRAMVEIVNHLDEARPFPDAAEESLHTLEIILACHASNRENAAWVTLPLMAPQRSLELNSG